MRASARVCVMNEQYLWSMKKKVPDECRAKQATPAALQVSNNKQKRKDRRNAKIYTKAGNGLFDQSFKAFVIAKKRSNPDKQIRLPSQHLSQHSQDLSWLCVVCQVLSWVQVRRLKNSQETWLEDLLCQTLSWATSERQVDTWCYEFKAVIPAGPMTARVSEGRLLQIIARFCSELMADVVWLGCESSNAFSASKDHSEVHFLEEHTPLPI